MSVASFLAVRATQKSLPHSDAPTYSLSKALRLSSEHQPNTSRHYFLRLLRRPSWVHVSRGLGGFTEKFVFSLPVTNVAFAWAMKGGQLILITCFIACFRLPSAVTTLNLNKQMKRDLSQTFISLSPKRPTLFPPLMPTFIVHSIYRTGRNFKNVVTVYILGILSFKAVWFLHYLNFYLGLKPLQRMISITLSNLG